MNTLKALVILLFLAPALKAQTGKSIITVSMDNHKDLAKNETAFIVYFLNLSKDQTDSVSKINFEYFLSIAELQLLKISPDERGRQLAMFTNKRRERLATILGESDSGRYFFSLTQRQTVWSQMQAAKLSYNQQKNK